MYRRKLEELCEENKWTAPEYTRRRAGPDHSLLFSCSVLVNGLNFDSKFWFKTARRAEKDAAQLALHHFTSSAGSSASNIDLNSAATPEKIAHSGTQETLQTPHYNGDALVVKETAEHGDSRHMYKNPLQTYTRIKNITSPAYYCERDGPIHASRFKARVVVDGKTFEASEYCNSIEEAEHAAAKAALISLALGDVKKDDSRLYKNLLQELAEKEGFSLPKYKTFQTHEKDLQVFVSTVKFKGEKYYGPRSRSKKQAEIGAAKVAYDCLKENASSQICKHQSPVTQDECGQSRKRQCLGAQGHEAHEVALPPMQLNVGLDGEQNVSLKSPSITDQTAALCKPQDPNAQGDEAHGTASSSVQLNVGLDEEQNVNLKSSSTINQTAASY